LPHLSHVLSLWARVRASSVVSRNEFVKGSCGGLEFIEYLWVGCCNPIEELHEVRVDYLKLSGTYTLAVSSHLNLVEVTADVVERFSQKYNVNNVPRSVYGIVN